MPFFALKHLKEITGYLIAIFLVYLMTTLLVSSCFGGSYSLPVRPIESTILQLTIEEIERLREVGYTDEPGVNQVGKDYVIRPQSEENVLMAVRIHLENNASAIVQLDMGALPPELRMDTGRYHSVDIGDARMPYEGFHAYLNEYVPLIRDFHLLEEGSDLEGWLIFDVPKDSMAESFKWEAGGDIIIIDL